MKRRMGFYDEEYDTPHYGMMGSVYNLDSRPEEYEEEGDERIKALYAVVREVTGTEIYLVYVEQPKNPIGFIWDSEAETEE